MFDAQLATALGVVHEVCDAMEVESRIRDYAAAATQNGPNAVQQCKQLIQSIGHDKIGAHTSSVTADLIAELRVSEEGQEGLTAFLQKRIPSWRSGQNQSEAQ